MIQRSDDGGRTWNAVGNEFRYEGEAGTHKWYDGTPHPWEFARVWHLEPDRTDPDTVYAGVEDAALFRSTDGGRSWHELAGLRQHPSGPSWEPGAGGLCLHTILLDPHDSRRIYTAISAAGAFRSDDGGGTWRPGEPRAAVRQHSGARGRGGPLRAPARHAPVPSPRCCSCRSTGT